MITKFGSKFKSPRGDTIIEVLLSVTALGMVLALSFTATTRSLNAGTDAANRNQALAFAREQVELLRDAANSGTIDNYPSNGNAFCIDPATRSSSQPDESGFCHLSGQDPFGVSIKYNDSNQTYTVTAEWQGATTQNQVLLYYQTPLSPINVSPAVDISISASPSLISSGGSTTITWTTTTALSCSASGAWQGSKPTSGSEDFDNIVNSSTYSLTCTGLDGVSTITRSAKVYVSPLPAPTISFKATPTTVAKGGTSTLDWTASGASGCSASGGWSGAQPTSGTYTTGAINSDTSFTLTCASDSGGPSSKSTVVVSVQSVPSVSLSASPDNIQYYQSTTLSWKVSGATSCNATSNTSWSGSIDPSDGSQTIYNLSSGTKNFTLTCTNSGGQKSASTTVFVNNNPGFCIDINYQNCTYFSHDVTNLNDYSLNDTISSVLVPPGRREIMYKDANFQGACYVATSNVPNMGNTNIGNDELSSFHDISGSSGC